MRARAFLLIGVLLGLARGAPAAVNVMVPTVAKVAPAAIWFNAKATTCAGFLLCMDPFLDLSYTWNFGDPNSGAWPTGNPKNTDVDPLGFHLYELPGAYQAQVRVCDRLGTCLVGSAPMVTVLDPNQAYPPAKTRCVSTAPGTFQGCPLDANGDGTCDVAPGNCLTDGRYLVLNGFRTLFRRGGTYTNPAYQQGSQPTYVAAFGTGPKPIIQHPAGTGQGIGIYNPAFTTVDSVFMDLDFRQAASPQTGDHQVALIFNFQNVTFLRLNWVGGNNGIQIECPNQSLGCRESAILESSTSNQWVGWAFQGGGEYNASFGNDFRLPPRTDGTKQGHVERHGIGRNLLVKYNRFEGPDHFHAGVVVRGDAGGAFASDGAIISDNLIVGNGFDQNVGISVVRAGTGCVPPNCDKIRHCIIERNTLVGMGLAGIQSACSDAKIQFNRVDASNAVSGISLLEDTGNGQDTVATQNVRLFNNWIFSSNYVRATKAIELQPNVRDVRLCNPSPGRVAGAVPVPLVNLSRFPLTILSSCL